MINYAKSVAKAETGVCFGLFSLKRFRGLYLGGPALYDSGMNQPVYVHLLPQLCEPQELKGSVAVVVDILRATTTITHALAQGAEEVYPALEVEQARTWAAEMRSEAGAEGAVLLGGERKGEKIAGFDLDNSPLAYTTEVVQGKKIVFTTTNGTKALGHCGEADSVYLGAFSAISALVYQLNGHEEPVHLLCAGTDGAITWEDVLFAGAVVNGLAQQGSGYPANDSAQLAQDSFLLQSDTAENFYRALATSRGGGNLVRLGFDQDIKQAAKWDLFQIVAKYDPDGGKIVRMVDNISKPIEKMPAPS